MGIQGNVSRNTLAHANHRRVNPDITHILIGRTRRLYTKDFFGIELNQTAYVLNSTLINLWLSLFPWAKFRKSKVAVKLQTLLDLCRTKIEWDGDLLTFKKTLKGAIDIRALTDYCLIFFTEKGRTQFRPSSKKGRFYITGH